MLMCIHIQSIIVLQTSRHDSTIYKSYHFIFNVTPIFIERDFSNITVIDSSITIHIFVSLMVEMLLYFLNNHYSSYYLFLRLIEVLISYTSKSIFLNGRCLHNCHKSSICLSISTRRLSHGALADILPPSLLLLIHFS